VSADLLPEALLVFGYVLIPGAGLCLATRVADGRSPFTLLAISFGFGFAGVSLASLLLVLLQVLDPVTLGVAWVAVSAVAWGVAIRGESLRGRMDGWCREALADPWASAGASLVVIGVVVARWTVDPIVNVAPTVLRYWADGLEIADAGQIPQGTLHWGTILPPITSKVVLNAFDAGVALLLGRGPTAPLGALLFFVAVGLTIVAIALLFELGIRRLAPVGALLLFFSRVTRSDLAIDLGRNLAENWGRLAALSAVLAAVLALRSSPSEATAGPSTRSDPGGTGSATIVSGILLATSAGTHLVAASFGLACVCALGVASLAVGRSVRQVLSRTVSIVVIAVVLGGTILAVAPGDLGFEGAVDPHAYRALRAELGLPPTFDPTRFITTHDIEAAQAPRGLGVGDVAEQFAFKLVGRNALLVEGESAPPWLLVVPAVVGLALAAALVLTGPSDLRVVALVAVMLAVVILVVGVLFALRYDLFALEFFGNRRLFSYSVVVSVLLITAAGEAALRWLGKRVGSRAASIVGCAIAVVVGTAMIPGSTVPKPTSDRAAGQVALLEWIEREVPCEGRVLSHYRTLGTFEVIAGRAAVLEGMGPHVRPPVLTLAIEEILRARDFFADPSGGLSYLRARGVAGVVVANPAPRYGLGGYSIGRVPLHRVDRVPFLRRGFENEAGVVYLMEGFEPNLSLPKVTGRPGFGCATV
jgi:hypothetical protein